MTADKISVELAPIGEYPPGEEWRGKIREGVNILWDLDAESDQWVKVKGIEPSNANRARSAAHAAANSKFRPFMPEDEEWQLVTRYDAASETLWMTAQFIKTSKGVESE